MIWKKCNAIHETNGAFELFTYREACLNVKRPVASVPVSAYILKECNFEYLFITGKKLTGELNIIPELVFRFFWADQLLRCGKVMTISIYTPSQALANTRWLHNIKPDALSVHLQVQNPLSKHLFLSDILMELLSTFLATQYSNI